MSWAWYPRRPGTGSTAPLPTWATCRIGPPASLASHRTGFIALILPNLTNGNFAAVAHGLTEVLRRADYDLLIAYTDYSLAEEERQLRNLLARRPEAIVLTGAVHRRVASRMLLAANIPVVELADLPRQPIEHAVGFSNYHAGRTAARYLIERGFRRIGAIASSTEGEIIDHRGEERMRGFEDELRLAGAHPPGAAPWAGTGQLRPRRHGDADAAERQPSPMPCSRSRSLAVGV